MPSTDFGSLRIHLYKTHKNLAAYGLSWEDAREQHWHEHHGPGGLRNHTHEPELEPHPGCPLDTNGDGDCGRPVCPYCSKLGSRLVRAVRRGKKLDPRWSKETHTAVAVYLATWYDEARGFDTTPGAGAAGLLAMLSDIGVLKPYDWTDDPNMSEEETMERFNELEPVEVVGPPDEREPECVANWPECYSGGYDPRCCRFPKSCSVETIQKRLINYQPNDLPREAPWGEPGPDTPTPSRLNRYGLPKICEIPDCGCAGDAHA